MVGHRDWVVATAISPDSKLVASGALDGTVRLWEAGSGREIARLEGHSGWVESVAFTPDGKRVVTGSRDGTVRLWEIGLLRSKRGAELRQWICDTKLRGAQEFTDDELAAPILKGISGDRRNPCRRRSSLDWWLGR
jgi:WD40 repeat protein